MLNHNIPAFDLLINQNKPYIGFGSILPFSNDLIVALNSEINRAKKHCSDIFSLNMDDDCRNVTEIDKIIFEMWNTGWNPDKNDINLFVCDFGLIFSKSIISNYGGTPIYRSMTNLDHFSIFWKDHQIEVFPFHKVLKCLWNSDGETLYSLYNGLQEYIKQ